MIKKDYSFWFNLINIMFITAINLIIILFSVYGFYQFFLEFFNNYLSGFILWIGGIQNYYFWSMLGLIFILYYFVSLKVLTKNKGEKNE